MAYWPLLALPPTGRDLAQTRIVVSVNAGLTMMSVYLTHLFPGFATLVKIADTAASHLPARVVKSSHARFAAWRKLFLFSTSDGHQ